MTQVHTPSAGLPGGLPAASLQGSERGAVPPPPARQPPLPSAGLGGPGAQPVRAFVQLGVRWAGWVAVGTRAFGLRRLAACGFSLRCSRNF